jgi:hypothetical protein
MKKYATVEIGSQSGNPIPGQSNFFHCIAIRLSLSSIFYSLPESLAFSLIP